MLVKIPSVKSIGRTSCHVPDANSFIITPGSQKIRARIEVDTKDKICVSEKGFHSRILHQRVRKRAVLKRGNSTVSKLQSMILLSSDAEARKSPSLDQETSLTPSVWPSNVLKISPV